MLFWTLLKAIHKTLFKLILGFFLLLDKWQFLDKLVQVYLVCRYIHHFTNQIRYKIV